MPVRPSSSAGDSDDQREDGMKKEQKKPFFSRMRLRLKPHHRDSSSTFLDEFDIHYQRLHLRVDFTQPASEVFALPFADSIQPSE
jgi:hypothetical protein